MAVGLTVHAILHTRVFSETLGYEIKHGPAIAAGEPLAECSDANDHDIGLEGQLHQALARLNPHLLAEAIEDAFRKVMRLDAPALLERNRAAHRMLLAGVTAEYRRPDGSISGELPIEDAERFIEGVK